MQAARIPLLKLETIREETDKVFLYATHLDAGFVADGCAALLCKELRGRQTFPALVDSLAERHQLPRERFFADAQAFLETLDQRGMIQWLDEPIRA